MLILPTPPTYLNRRVALVMLRSITFPEALPGGPHLMVWGVSGSHCLAAIWERIALVRLLLANLLCSIPIQRTGQPLCHFLLAIVSQFLSQSVRMAKSGLPCR